MGLVAAASIAAIVLAAIALKQYAMAKNAIYRMMAMGMNAANEALGPDAPLLPTVPLATRIPMTPMPTQPPVMAQPIKGNVPMFQMATPDFAQQAENRRLAEQNQREALRKRAFDAMPPASQAAAMRAGYF
jgi:hypothetical protein